MAAPSTCTARAVRAYFQDGVLPPDGTRCDPELLPFDDPDDNMQGTTAYDEEEDSESRDLAMASWALSRWANWGLDRGERV